MLIIGLRDRVLAEAGDEEFVEMPRSQTIFMITKLVIGIAE
jgi:hypothetical protein